MYVPVSSTTSIKDLYNTMIIEKPAEGKYGILDKVFRTWIKRNILKTENEKVKINFLLFALYSVILRLIKLNPRNFKPGY